MVGKKFLLRTSLFGLFFIVFFGLKLVYQSVSIKPEFVFNYKDREVCFINNLSNLSKQELHFTPHKSLDKLVDQLLENPIKNARVILSSSRPILLINKFNFWNKENIGSLISRVFKKKAIISLSDIRFGNDFHVDYSKDFLLIYQGEMNVDFNAKMKWPSMDLNATESIVHWGKPILVDEFYKNSNGTVIHKYSKKELFEGEKVDDRALFSQILPVKLTDYHFYEKSLAFNKGIVDINSALYRWCDKGFAVFKYESVPVIVSDYLINQDPFDVLQEMTDEENTIAGLHSHYTGIPLTNSIPYSLDKGFYIQSIGGCMLMCSRKEVLDQVNIDYELGKTIALNKDKFVEVYGNLPSKVSEREVRYGKSITTSIQNYTKIKMERTSDLIPSNEFVKEEISKNYLVDGKVLDVLSDGNKLFFWTDKNKVFAVKNNKVSLLMSFKSDYIGGVFYDDQHFNKPCIIFTTKDFIYGIDCEGKPISDFPIPIKSKCQSSASWVKSKNKDVLSLVNEKDEFMIIDYKGKLLKSIFLKNHNYKSELILFKDRRVSYCLAIGEEGSDLINLDKLSYEYTVSSIPKESTFSTKASDLVFFYVKDKKMIKNNFKGLETVMSSFSNVISLKSFSSITSNNFALFTKGSFIWLNDFGNEVFKIDLPSTNFSEIDVKVSSNGKMYIVFLDTIENSIYIYDKSKNQFFEKQYEGSEFVYLEEIDNHFFVITKKSNMLIMHKIN